VCGVQWCRVSCVRGYAVWWWEESLLKPFQSVVVFFSVPLANIEQIDSSRLVIVARFLSL
jgi:hypothetical protein